MSFLNTSSCDNIRINIPAYFEWNPGTSANLIVSILSPEDYPTAQKIVQHWEDQATHAIHNCRRETSDCLDRFQDCAWVAGFAKQTMQGATPGDGTEVHLCLQGNKPQGIATLTTSPLYEDHYLYMKDLVSNPENIPCSANQSMRIRGTGTALIGSSVQRSKELDAKGVCVAPTPNAKAFYEKLGFEPKEGSFLLFKE